MNNNYKSYNKRELEGIAGGDAGAKTMNHSNLIIIPHANPTMKCYDSNRMFVRSFIL